MSKYRLAVLDEDGAIVHEAPFVPRNECEHDADGPVCTSDDCGLFVLTDWSVRVHRERA